MTVRREHIMVLKVIESRIHPVRDRQIAGIAPRFVYPTLALILTVGFVGAAICLAGVIPLLKSVGLFVAGIAAFAAIFGLLQLAFKWCGVRGVLVVRANTLRVDFAMRCISVPLAAITRVTITQEPGEEHFSMEISGSDRVLLLLEIVAADRPLAELLRLLRTHGIDIQRA